MSDRTPTVIEEPVIDLDFRYVDGSVSNLTLLAGDQLELPNQFAPSQYLRATLQNKMFGNIPETITIPIQNVLYWSQRQTTRRFTVPTAVNTPAPPPPPATAPVAPTAPSDPPADSLTGSTGRRGRKPLTRRSQRS